MSTKEETWQWFSPEAEQAIREALKPIPRFSSSNDHPDGGESYQCESCPAEFGFQPEGFICPICKRGLTGTVTINFYPPQPPEDE